MGDIRLKISTLFDLLDLNRDGQLSRLELHTAAKRLGWHWHEAPLFALLDLFSIQNPISKRDFKNYWKQITEDPMGVYGRVLLESPLFTSGFQSTFGRSTDLTRHHLENHPKKSVKKHAQHSLENLSSLLKNHCSVQAANAFLKLRNTLTTLSISAKDAALLIIDPQKSFTSGVWMASIRENPRADVMPIMLAFENCRNLLKTHYGQIEIMFSRCPFPPGSYDWDPRFAGILDTKQLYFIKPGNNILFPPTNGFKEWVTHCVESGKRNLVIGGCTLNSCVRVSAIEIRNYFRKLPLQVVVDLSLGGARMVNFHPSTQYEGLSAVESAVQQMKGSGVNVVQYVQWENKRPG